MYVKFLSCVKLMEILSKRNEIPYQEGMQEVSLYTRSLQLIKCVNEDSKVIRVDEKFILLNTNFVINHVTEVEPKLSKNSFIKELVYLFYLSHIRDEEAEKNEE